MMSSETVFPEVKSLAVKNKDRSNWENSLTEYVNTFLAELYPHSTFDHIAVYVDNKMADDGRFAREVTDDEHEHLISRFITIRGAILTMYQLTKDVVVLDYIENMLRHEAIHYALWDRGITWQDGSAYFEAMLHVTNTTPSGKTPENLRYQGVFPSVHARYAGKCPTCGAEGLYKSRHKYACTDCDKNNIDSVFRPHDLVVCTNKACTYRGKDYTEPVAGLTKDTFNYDVKLNLSWLK